MCDSKFKANRLFHHLKQPVCFEMLAQKTYITATYKLPEGTILVLVSTE